MANPGGLPGQGPEQGISQIPRGTLPTGSPQVPQQGAEGNQLERIIPEGA